MSYSYNHRKKLRKQLKRRMRNGDARGKPLSIIAQINRNILSFDYALQEDKTNAVWND